MQWLSSYVKPAVNVVNHSVNGVTVEVSGSLDHRIYQAAIKHDVDEVCKYGTHCFQGWTRVVAVLEHILTDEKLSRHEKSLAKNNTTLYRTNKNPSGDICYERIFSTSHHNDPSCEEKIRLYIESNGHMTFFTDYVKKILDVSDHKNDVEVNKWLFMLFIRAINDKEDYMARLWPTKPPVLKTVTHFVKWCVKANGLDYAVREATRVIGNVNYAKWFAEIEKSWFRNGQVHIPDEQYDLFRFYINHLGAKWIPITERHLPLLRHACKEGNRDQVKVIMAKAKVNLKCYFNQGRPVLYAIQQGHVDIVKYLIPTYVPGDLKLDGRTWLDIAAKFKQKQIAQYFSSIGIKSAQGV